MKSTLKSTEYSQYTLTIQWTSMGKSTGRSPSRSPSLSPPFSETLFWHTQFKQSSLEYIIKSLNILAKKKLLWMNLDNFLYANFKAKISPLDVHCAVHTMRQT